MSIKKLSVWIISFIVFAIFVSMAYSGSMGYKNISKEKILAKDGSKRGPHYRSSYYGGAYRYGK